MPSKPKHEISFTSEIRVRFVETDPLGIVWHGNYIQYFEEVELECVKYNDRIIAINTGKILDLSHQNIKNT